MTTVYIVLFYVNIIKNWTRSYHCRFTQSKPDRESHVAALKNVVIRCCKWLSFQSAEYNHHWWDNQMIKITQPKRPFSTFSFTERQWQYISTYLQISYWYDYYKSHFVWESVSKIQAPWKWRVKMLSKNGLLKWI